MSQEIMSNVKSQIPYCHVWIREAAVALCIGLANLAKLSELKQLVLFNKGRLAQPGTWRPNEMQSASKLEQLELERPISCFICKKRRPSYLRHTVALYTVRFDEAMQCMARFEF